MKKNFFRLLLLTVLMLAGGNVWAAEGDVTTNADIDFSNAIVTSTSSPKYSIAGAVGSMTWDQQWTMVPGIVDGILQFGNFSGGNVTLENNNIRSKDVVKISFEMAFGKLSGKHVGFKFVDTSDDDILTQWFDAYNGDFDDSNPLNLDWNSMYRNSNTPIQERCVYFTITINYAEHTIKTKTKCYLSGVNKPATESEFTAELPSSTPIGAFVLMGNINNAGRYSTFDNLLIKTIEGNYSSDTADYTVNWVCDNQTVKSQTRNGEVDSDIVLNNADKEPFFNSNETKRYIYVSDDSEGKTVSDETTTVVTVNVKEAAKYAYTVTSAYNGQPLDWSTTGEVWEDLNTVTVQYPRFQAADNVLVQRTPVNNDLKTNVTVTSNGFTTSLDYAQYNGIDNLYLLSEAENLETDLSTNATSFTSRVSNGQIAFGASGTLLTLPAGTYIFTLGVIGGDNNTHQVAYTVSAGDTQIIEGTCTGNMLNLMTSEEFTLNADTPITFTCSDPSSSRGIDLIFVQKIADAVTMAYTINYLFEGETVFTETGEGAQGVVIEAKESVTVTTGEGDETTTQTYYLDDNQTTSLTINADEANNVLNVAVRLPRTADVTVNAVDDQGTVLKSFTAEATEGGEAVWVYYTRAVEVDGVYYTVPAKNGNGRNYGVSKSYGDEPTEITYTKNESISYYAEAEDLNKSRSYAAEGQAAERASGGHWWRLSKASYAYTPALEGGVYTVYVSGRGERAAEVGIQVRYPDGTLVGENTLSWASSQNAEQSVEGVNVPEGCSVAVVNPDADYNNQLGFDYIILAKTGEAKTELITVTSAGARTYCSKNVLDFSNVEGLKAYYLTVDGDQISMDETSLVGGYVGVYIEAAEGSYEVPVLNDLAVEPLPPGVNDLVGVAEETQVEAPIYVLMNADNRLGFYKTSKTFTVGAHTAYIPGDKVNASVKSLTFMNNEPTGISDVTLTARVSRTP